MSSAAATITTSSQINPSTTPKPVLISIFDHPCPLALIYADYRKSCQCCVPAAILGAIVFFVMKWKSPEGSRCLLEFVVSHGTHNQTCLVHSRISRPQRRKKINREPAALMGVTVSLNWTAFAALPSRLRASEWCFQSFRHWRLEIGSLPMCVSMDYADNIPTSAGQGSACADQRTRRSCGLVSSFSRSSLLTPWLAPKRCTPSRMDDLTKSVLGRKIQQAKCASLLS